MFAGWLMVEEKRQPFPFICSYSPAIMLELACYYLILFLLFVFVYFLCIFVLGLIDRATMCGTAAGLYAMMSDLPSPSISPSFIFYILP